MFDSSVALHESDVSSLTPTDYRVMSLSSIYFTSKYLIYSYLGYLKINRICGEWISKRALHVSWSVHF